MSSSSTPKSFNLAIIGGGISGLTLAIALHKRNIPITIYESAASFGEIGAGLGFQPNSVRTMELIAPGIKEGFLRCANNQETDPPKWFDVRIGDTREADSEGFVREKDGRKIKLGDPIFTIPARPGPRGGVHRAHFLDELVKLLPEGIAQFVKRLVEVTETDGGDAVLHFADGTTAQHTAVIGCDGIKSRTREIVLGKVEARPLFSGKYAYRAILPMQKALEFLEHEQATTPQMYCGYQRHVLTFPIANGTIFNGMPLVQFQHRFQAKGTHSGGFQLPGPVDQPRVGSQNIERRHARRLRTLGRESKIDHSEREEPKHLGALQPRPSAHIIPNPPAYMLTW
ncbi:hypothetical protein PMIN05_005831 [Paraphaeosphaeria minitans]